VFVIENFSFTINTMAESSKAANLTVNSKDHQKSTPDFTTISKFRQLGFSFISQAIKCEETEKGI